MTKRQQLQLQLQTHPTPTYIVSDDLTHPSPTYIVSDDQLATIDIRNSLLIFLDGQIYK